jgi:hypothetical protein
VRLGLEGADIIAVDICRQIDGVPYPIATAEDLDQTVKEVEALGRRIVARQADVRDEAGLKAAFDAGVAELGPAEIVVADAGIATMSLHETNEAWQVVIDVDFTGTFSRRGRTASDDQARPGWGHRAHRFQRRPGWHRRPEPRWPGRHRVQAWLRWPHTQLRRQSGPPPDPDELGASDRRPDAIDGERARTTEIK